MNNELNQSGICTLFEGDYHFGVGALVNSLYLSGYRGCVWAGYRGALPPWASVDSSGYMQVAEGISIRFIQLDTKWHLTNYKPTFMRELWEKEGATWTSLFYFDPDIVVKAKWDEFVFWAEAGVAVVEDVMNGKVGPTHPLRARWRKFADQMHLCVCRSGEAFCNGGFVGLNRRDIQFLVLWEKLLTGIFANFKIDPVKFMCGGLYTRAFPFIGTDQDTLNLALMIHPGAIAMVGPDGMDFAQGGYFMSHAIASPKPWRGGTMKAALSGFPPTQAIKFYHFNTLKPIRLYTDNQRKWNQLILGLSTFIGRFYRRL